MRAIWKGTVSFGLVNVSVRMFGAIQEHDIHFHQVHLADGGRIRMKRVCASCEEEIPYDQLTKAYESADGRTVMLTDEDFAELPLSTSREIDVLEFVPREQIDPILFDRTYFLEPDALATRPYALLREVLEATDRVAVVKVSLHQRETLAVLRARDRVIALQTLLWPDEVRPASFDVLDSDVDLRPAELAMAEALAESLATDFQPDQYEDQYTKTVATLVENKLADAELPPTTAADTASGEAIDLLTTLRHSVERARASRGEAAPAPDDEQASTSTKDAATKHPAHKGTKSGEEEKTPTKAATKKPASKKTSRG